MIQIVALAQSWLFVNIYHIPWTCEYRSCHDPTLRLYKSGNYRLSGIHSQTEERPDKDTQVGYFGTYVATQMLQGDGRSITLKPHTLITNSLHPHGLVYIRGKFSFRFYIGPIKAFVEHNPRTLSCHLCLLEKMKAICRISSCQSIGYDICQVWMWIDVSHRYTSENNDFANEEINAWNFRKPHYTLQHCPDTTHVIFQRSSFRKFNSVGVIYLDVMIYIYAAIHMLIHIICISVIVMI